jgi:hypothetical protein
LEGGGQFGSAVDAELFVDALEPVLDGAHREAQLLGDLFVGSAGGREEGCFALGGG